MTILGNLTRERVGNVFSNNIASADSVPNSYLKICYQDKIFYIPRSTMKEALLIADSMLVNSSKNQAHFAICQMCANYVERIKTSSNVNSELTENIFIWVIKRDRDVLDALNECSINEDRDAAEQAQYYMVRSMMVYIGENFGALDAVLNKLRVDLSNQCFDVTFGNLLPEYSRFQKE